MQSGEALRPVSLSPGIAVCSLLKPTSQTVPRNDIYSQEAERRPVLTAPLNLTVSPLARIGFSS